MIPKTESLGHVVGRNLRRLRAERDASQEDISQIARNLGLSWSASRVNALQRGSRNPKLSTVLALSRVLDCTVPALLATDADFIDIEEITLPAECLRDMFTEQIPWVYPSNPISLDEWAASRGWGNAEHMRDGLGLGSTEMVDVLQSMSLRCGITESRTAKALGMDIDVLNMVTIDVFKGGKTFGEHRDHIAAEEHRSLGDVTTELRERVRQHIEGWPDERLNPTHYPPDSLA
ncbi:helix-turn-helix domain-containing protein [Mycolicibacter arupensis]|jgi:transcriptional regulator with XRE-family HTH domain|uniref:XRE family transcriptional regulator n=1 Tax=Mycolicibacter arupensis TaxID=342002 RepID=A0A5C7YD79_9MYCO|nr:helix-turn-helix transcriptional regulator [Mycolicibacter arupensis]TXI59965.1 MAG: XRE family transcriptional regulator [Mycolicibacter arupensis]